MEPEAIKKLPRLYVDARLKQGEAVALTGAQVHYFRTVLRRQDGDAVRLFNGLDGEWAARLDGLGKKSGGAVPLESLRAQPPAARRLQLLFAPIKKHRMDFLIEKATELGATDLRPVITQNTEVRKVNGERLRLQVIEAAEQCERMDIPQVHAACDLKPLIRNWPADQTILACLERQEAPHLIDAVGADAPVAVLIGPEGGFTQDETELLLNSDRCRAVSLGSNILRAETAALTAVAIVRR